MFHCQNAHNRAPRRLTRVLRHKRFVTSSGLCQGCSHQVASLMNRQFCLFNSAAGACQLNTTLRGMHCRSCSRTQDSCSVVIGRDFCCVNLRLYIHIHRKRSGSFVRELGTSDRDRFHVNGVFVSRVHSFGSVHHGCRRT